MNTSRLFVIVAVASLITTTVFCGLSLTLGFLLDGSSVPQAVVVVMALFVPSGVAAWRIFKKLRPCCSRREARAVAMAFGLFNPIWLGVGVLVSQIPAGYSDLALGSAFATGGALFLGMVIVTTLLSFAACVGALGDERRFERVHQTK